MYDLSSEEDKLRKTRDLSVKESAATAVMSGAADSYVAPFAIELGSNNFQIGLLTSLNALVSPIIQIFGSRLMEKFNRRTIAFTAIVLQSTALLGFVLIGLAFLWQPRLFSWPVIFIVAYIIYGLSGSFGGPAWFSMIGDAVPENIRGRYFARRNRVANYVNIGVTLTGALFLYYLKASGYLIAGFVTLFAIASLGRFLAALLIKKHYAADITFDKSYYFSFWRFIRLAPTNNFGKFTIYVALTNLAVNIANPFFAVYMWKNLALNPVWFMAVSISTTFYSALSMKPWGKFADKYGNKELLRISWILFGFAPLFWIFSSHPVYLILVPQLLMGVGWAGFALATSNFIYDNVTSPRRGIVVAYYNLINGFGVFLGATVGGLISQYLSLSFINILFVLFILSAVLRVLVSILFLPKLKEVRNEILPAESNPLKYFTKINYLPDYMGLWLSYHRKNHQKKRE